MNLLKIAVFINCLLFLISPAWGCDSFEDCMEPIKRVRKGEVITGFDKEAVDQHLLFATVYKLDEISQLIKDKKIDEISSTRKSQSK